jgi:uncharacterized protein
VNGHSALYVGSISHQRLSPQPHGFRYSAFWTLIDLDELPALTAGLRWFSHNRFNLFALHDRDHGDGSCAPLRLQVERHLAEAGIATAGTKIRLLCVPRTLGYHFNPLSVYFCHRSDGTLAALIYEVHNTFRQRHSYLIPVEVESRTIHQHCDKNFYVSPFMDMDLRYEFQVSIPGKHVAVTIDTRAGDKLVFNAHLVGVRRALDNDGLLRIFRAIPLITLKITAAIHWEALRLWLKGLRLRARPPPPERLVTIVSGTSKTSE